MTTFKLKFDLNAKLNNGKRHMPSSFRKWTLVIQIWVMTEVSQTKVHSYSFICWKFLLESKHKIGGFQKIMTLNALFENRYVKTCPQSRCQLLQRSCVILVFPSGDQRICTKWNWKIFFINLIIFIIARWKNFLKSSKWVPSSLGIHLILFHKRLYFQDLYCKLDEHCVSA